MRYRTDANTIVRSIRYYEVVVNRREISQILLRIKYVHY